MTSTFVSDLEAVSLGLVDDRVTVRKKNGERLFDLLRNRRAINLLDEQTNAAGRSRYNSSGAAVKAFTWNKLFKSAMGYLTKEASKMHKDSEKVSAVDASALRNHQQVQNQKVAAVSLLNAVLRTANSRGGALIRGDLMLDSLLSFLGLEPPNRFIRRKFGADAVHLLLKHFFTSSNYLSSVPVANSDGDVNKWSILLDVAVQLFEIPPEGLDFHSCCDFLNKVITKGCFYTDLVGPLVSKLPSIGNILESSKLKSDASNETKSSLIESVVIALLTVCQDYWETVCQFGKEHIDAVLDLYDEKTSHSILQFLHLVVSVHHPLGARSSEEGAMGTEGSDWQRQLKRVYVNIVSTTVDNLQYLNRSRVINKDYCLKDSVVELAVKLGHQIFHSGSEYSGGQTLEGEGSVEITQVVKGVADCSGVDSQADHILKPAKKRRVEFSFKSCWLDNLSIFSSSFGGEELSFMPWLQILCRYADLHPEVLIASKDLLQSTLRTLLTVLQDSRDSRIKAMIFQCFCVTLDRIPCRILDLGETELLQLWDSAINAVSLNQCTKEGFRLIRTLLGSYRQEFVKNGKHLKLFECYINKLVKCDEDSTLSLLHLIAKCPRFPQIQSAVAGAMGSSLNLHESERDSRMAVLGWMQPAISGVDADFPSVDNPRLAASVLIGITTQCKSPTFQSLLAAYEGGRIAEKDLQTLALTDFDKQLSTLEKFLVASSFGSVSINTDPTGRLSEYSGPNVREDVTVLADTKNCVQDLLISQCGKVLDLLDRNSRVQDKDRAVGTCTKSAACALALGNCRLLLSFLDLQSRLSTISGTSRGLANRLFSVITNLLTASSNLTFEEIPAEDHKVSSPDWISKVPDLARAWRLFFDDLKKCDEGIKDLAKRLVENLLTEQSFFSKMLTAMENCRECLSKYNKASVGQLNVSKNQSAERKNASNNRHQETMGSDEEVDFIDSEPSGRNRQDVDMDDDDNGVDDFEEDNLQEMGKKTAAELVFRSISDLVAVLSAAFESFEFIECKISEVGPSSPDLTSALSSVEVETFQSLTNIGGMLKELRFGCDEEENLILNLLTALEFLLVNNSSTNCSIKTARFADQCYKDALKLLQGFCKSKTLPGNFCPSVCLGIIRCLRSLQRHMVFQEKRTFETRASDAADSCFGDEDYLNVKQLLVAFLKTFVRMQSKCCFSRYSVAIKADMVGFGGDFADFETSPNHWASWSSSVYNLCSTDKRETMMDGDESVLVSRSLVRFLSDPSFVVRMKAAEKVPKIIVVREKCNHQVFEDVCLELTTLPKLPMDALRKRAPVLSADEETASFLITMVSVAAGCPKLRPVAVAKMIMHQRKRGISPKRIKSALAQLASVIDPEKPSQSVADFLKPACLLKYLLWQFFKASSFKCNIEDFPHSLLGCQNAAEFVSKFEGSLVPIALWAAASHVGEDHGANIKRTLALLSSTLGIGDKQVLTRNFAGVASLIFPLVAAKLRFSPDRLNRIPRQDISKAEAVDALFVDILDKDEYHGLLNNHVPELLSEVLKRLHSSLDDEDSLEGMANDYPFAGLPEQLVSNLIDYLSVFVENGRGDGEKRGLFGHLVAIFPDCLQRMSEDLSEPLKSRTAAESTSVTRSRLRALCGIKFFIKRLAIEAAHLEHQLPFLCWFLGRTLLGLLDKDMSRGSHNQEDRHIIIAASKALEAVVELTRSDGPVWEILSDQVASSMKRFLQNKDAAAKVPLAAESWKRLLQRTGDVSLNLNQDAEPAEGFTIETFLSRVGTEGARGASKELLKAFLLHLKSASKLFAVSDEKSSGDGSLFSEDMADCTAHRVIHCLIELAFKKDVSSEVAALAIKCLGEIGPVDLQSLMLAQSVQEDPQQDAKAADPKISRILFESLLECVADEDHQVSATASRALKHLLHTKDASNQLQLQRQTSNGQQKWRCLLVPFEDALGSTVIDKEAISKSGRQSSSGLHELVSEAGVADNTAWLELPSASTTSCSHGSWVSRLTLTFLKSLPKVRLSSFKDARALGRHLIGICHLRHDVCEKIFPYVVQETLLFNSPLVRSAISANICSFFQHHFQTVRFTSNDGVEKSATISQSYGNLKCVETMLRIIELLRTKDPPALESGCKWTCSSNYWIENLNYLHVANAALECSLHFATCLYIDLWCHSIKTKSPNLKDKSGSPHHYSMSLLDAMYEEFEDNGPMLEDLKRCQQIMQIAYSSLGDEDAVRSCGGNRLLDSNARIQQCLLENKSLSAFQSYDQILAKNAADNRRDCQGGLMSSLMSSGCYHTFTNYVRGCSRQDLASLAKVQEQWHDCLWRLSEWSEIEDGCDEAGTNAGSYSKHHYRALRDLCNISGLDERSLQLNLSAAYTSEAQANLMPLQKAGCEGLKGEVSLARIYPSLARFRSLTEASVLSSLVGKSCTTETAKKVLADLEERDSNVVKSSTDFLRSEPVLTQRLVVLSNILEVGSADPKSSGLRRPEARASSPRSKFKGVSKKRINEAVQKICLDYFVSYSFKLCREAIRSPESLHVAQNSLNGLKLLLSSPASARLIQEESSIGIGDGCSRNLKNEVQYFEAIISWAFGDTMSAKSLLKDLCRKLEKQCSFNTADDSSLKYREKLALAKALETLGCWMCELRSESASTIRDSCLQKSVELFEEVEKWTSKSTTSYSVLMENNITEAYLSLAKFCDDQFRHIDDYMKSKDFEDKNNLMKRIKEESDSIRNVGCEEATTRKAVYIMERHSVLDQNEVKSLKVERLGYLLAALENYCKALSRRGRQSTGHQRSSDVRASVDDGLKSKCGESESSTTTKHDLRIFRLISLWFSNMFEKAVNQAVAKGVSGIPSYKFVGLMYQICARMITTAQPGVHSEEFPGLLKNLISRCAKEHPYQTLPIILALSNSNADAFEVSASKSNVGQKDQLDEDGTRSEAATNLLRQLSSVPGKMGKLIEQMNAVSMSYIKLAYAKVSKTDMEKMKTRPETEFEIPRDQAIREIRSFDGVPVTTTTIPVVSGGSYPGVVGIVGFEKKFCFVGGLTAPKKLRCLGTDGKWRTQLVKGLDDLRQDAVMQQVFGLMNTLLRCDEAARRRRLQIRTYKVVPLSQRSGVLEWCENTMPIRDYLVGSDQRSGAHKKYNPSDLVAIKCREILSKRPQNDSKAKLLKDFENICQKFHPVMRYFFYERFASPGRHFERRQAYMRSTAASSMVGYILGLGDRHVQNILLDKKTAELIHIDLGVAFEQGKILPTPETIPFRLTRDIVDGFGISGVEGAFRRCCEVSLDVMRGNKDFLMTILEVMMFDPLYNWSLTPAKVYRLQRGKDSSAKRPGGGTRPQENKEAQGQAGNNKMAERVLLRVTQKLNGMEEGYHLSVEGHVNLLIQQATDPTRLCAVFHGWQPYI